MVQLEATKRRMVKARLQPHMQNMLLNLVHLGELRGKYYWTGLLGQLKHPNRNYLPMGPDAHAIMTNDKKKRIPNLGCYRQMASNTMCWQFLPTLQGRWALAIRVWNTTQQLWRPLLSAEEKPSKLCQSNVSLSKITGGLMQACETIQMQGRKAK